MFQDSSAAPGQEHSAPVAGPAIDTSEGVNFADILRAILKGKWLILACATASVLCSLGYVSITKAVYEANGVVRIDPTRSGSLGLTDVLAGGSGDVIPTEIGILTSDQVALSAENMLTPEEFQRFAGFPKDRMLFRQEDDQHRPIHLNPQQVSALEKFRGAIRAKQNEGTQLVTITYRDGDPEMAALLVNHSVDAYMRQSFESRYTSVSQVRSWLSEQMNGLQQRATDAQRKLADFQQANNLVGTDLSNNSVTDRLKLLNERVTQAEGDRIVKEAQMRAARDGDPAVLASLIPDPHLEALQSTEATLYAQYTQLASKFGDKYPPLAEVRGQLQSVREEISKSIGVISSHLQQDFQASQQAEAMLRKEYEAEISRAYALNSKQADYAVLVAEGTSSRDLYNILEYRLQQATVNAGLDSINTMIVDRARTPLIPVEPKKTLIVISGFILGLALGLGAALLKEALGGEIQNIQQIESRTGLALLAVTPHISLSARKASNNAKQLGRTTMPLVVVAEPRSRATESYRTMRNSILLSSLDRPPKLTLITSSIPKEGKTYTACNYAVILAQHQAKVLIIDADLRRPSVHTVFNIPNVRGLSDYLLDPLTESGIVAPLAEVPNLHVMTAGTNLAFPSETLASSKLRAVLEQWKTEYDIIILDSAPLLIVSDSLPLASYADNTVLIARVGLTPLKGLLRTRAILLRAHARVAGVLLNDVSQSGADSGYYEGDYGYYS